MKNFLQKIKLIDHLTLKLFISKSEFVRRLSAITDKEKIGRFFSLPDFLSSGEKDFKGEVESDGFRLQKRVQHLERNLNWAIAKGTIIEKNDFLIVDIEIKGIIFKLILGWMVMLIAITIFILININIYYSIFLIGLPLMYFITYLNMKNDVERLKYDLERELINLHYDNN